jgi:type II secretory pathway pseudopilin PulG
LAQAIDQQCAFISVFSDLINGKTKTWRLSQKSDRSLAMPLLIHPPVRQTLRTSVGFTLVDLAVVMAIIGILSAIAVPQVARIGDAIALGEAQRLIQSELQRARLKSVTTNRVIRVRFNCPANGQFRMVELVGTSTIPAAADVAANRCSETAYPYPSADTNPITLPNQDGPIRRINSAVSFVNLPTIEFRPSGTAWSVNADGTSTTPLAGNGVSITVQKGNATKAITVIALGKVHGL